MIEAFAQALAILFEWPNPLLWIGATIIGLIFGIIPGLSGAVAVALLIPVTYGMNVAQAMMVLIPASGGSAFGGSISAILINTPGESINAATALDGYPLARQGKAGVAIGASAMASLLGALVGVVVLAVSIPFMMEFLLLFGPPEYFMLVFLGIVLIALAVEGTLLASLISGLLGILLSFHGFVGVVGGDRFTFGTSYLWDGIPLLPVFIGLFGINGAIDLLLSGTTVSDKRYLVTGGVWEGIRSVFVHRWLMLRASLIGVAIGIIPGVGGAVSNFVAYVHAKQSSRNPERFGKGAIEGVIAPEASNDAKDGGSLMPTMALGIPGSAGMAVLLGGFYLHGINPGPELFSQHLDLVWVIIFALVASNIITSLTGVVLVNQLVKITQIPVKLYAPPILVLCFLGAHAVNRSHSDMVLALAFGFIGYILKDLKYSRVALVVGLMLGSLAEANFFQSLQIARGQYSIFWTRPVALALGIMTLVALVAPFVVSALSRRGGSRDTQE